MKKVNLNSEHYTDLFRAAGIYAKSATVEAIQVDAEKLQSGEYAKKDVWFDEVTGQYKIDTYVTEVKNGVFDVRLETTNDINPGDWILTNPKSWANERDNNYAVSNEKFQSRYEPTDKPGIYRAKGITRIIKNDTAGDVEIDAPWGGIQTGDAECYFCVPYERDNPDAIPENDRYILSANDFQKTYAPVADVLGEDWRK